MFYQYIARVFGLKKRDSVCRRNSNAARSLPFYLTAFVSAFAVYSMFSTSDAQAQPTQADFDAAFDAAVIVTTDLGDGIYVMECMGVNSLLLTGDDGALFMDTCWDAMSDKLMVAIREQTDQPIKYVVLTHWHNDHTQGNKNFANMGSIIVAHEGTRERLSVDTARWPSGRILKAAPPAALPVITFNDNATFYMNGQQINFISVEHAHTHGDIIAVLPNANIIHAGDVFLNGSYPNIEYDKGGTLVGTIESANMILEIADDDTIIIPGHLELADKADLIRFRDMMFDLKDRVAEGQDSDKSLEELLAEEPLRHLENDWGTGAGPLHTAGNVIYERIYMNEQFAEQ